MTQTIRIFVASKEFLKHEGHEDTKRFLVFGSVSAMGGRLRDDGMKTEEIINHEGPRSTTKRMGAGEMTKTRNSNDERMLKHE